MVLTMAKMSDQRHREELLTDAEIKSLHSILQEVCLRLGVSKEDFQRQYIARRNRFHDQALEEVEDTDPSLAALLDARPLGICGDDAPIEPLFPPSSSE